MIGAATLVPYAEHKPRQLGELETVAIRAGASATADTSFCVRFWHPAASCQAGFCSPEEQPAAVPVPAPVDWPAQTDSVHPRVVVAGCREVPPTYVTRFDDAG